MGSNMSPLMNKSATKATKHNLILKPVIPPKKRDTSQYSGSDDAKDNGYQSSGQ